MPLGTLFVPPPLERVDEEALRQNTATRLLTYFNL